MISENDYAHVLVDLATGATTPVAGLESLLGRSPTYLDATPSGDLDGSDELVGSLEMDPHRGSPIEVWGGTPESRVLLSSVPLRAGFDELEAFAYAPDRGLLFAEVASWLPPSIEVGHRVVGIGLDSGEIEVEYHGLEDIHILTFAYDPAAERLLVLDFDGRVSEIAL
jgi:hypothetical protein